MIIDKTALRKFALGLAAVTELVIYTLSGFAVGYFADHWIKITTPWLSVLLTLLGFTGGAFRLYRIFVRDDDEPKSGSGTT